jgi:hypothetical protein
MADTEKQSAMPVDDLYKLLTIADLSLHWPRELSSIHEAAIRELKVHAEHAAKANAEAKKVADEKAARELAERNAKEKARLEKEQAEEAARQKANAEQKKRAEAPALVKPLEYRSPNQQPSPTTDYQGNPVNPSEEPKRRPLDDA